MKRVIIGFGAGASEVEVRTQTFQQTEYGLRQLTKGLATADGAKMPGMAWIGVSLPMPFAPPVTGVVTL
jgi:hypothetical protein